MFFTAIIAAGVVLSGVDFVTIVLTSYAIRTAILIPLILALFWSRTTGWGFVGGTVLAIAIGMPIRSAPGGLSGSLSILALSAVVPIIFGSVGNFISTWNGSPTLRTRPFHPKRRRGQPA